jgi:ferredoxin-NADP reductase
MGVTQKLACLVETIDAHGEHVYSVTLRPQRPAPRFRAGQFLHLALDPYDPTGFWPESRVFSIASSPADRSQLRITYAVHGEFTARMENELVEGRQVWIKMPYGDFLIEEGADVMLFAGGTGITAFTAFLETLPGSAPHSVALAFGARRAALLIYRDVLERCAGRRAAVSVSYFVEHPGAGDPSGTIAGQVTLDAIWPRIERPFGTGYYIAGPPSMLRSIGDGLRARDIAPEAIHVDCWE